MTRKEPTSFKEAKRKINRSPLADDEPTHIRKPGLETSYPHIAMMFTGRDNDVALELSRGLLPQLAAQLGVRRRPSGRLSR